MNFSSPDFLDSLRAIGWIQPVSRPSTKDMAAKSTRSGRAARVAKTALNSVVSRSATSSDQRAEKTAGINSRFSPVYLKFINSKEWREKRRQRIEKDTVNGKVICQFCGKPCFKDDPAEVDHFRYPPRDATFEDFVNQPLEDLRTLHRSCHKLKTERSRKK